MLRLVGLWTEPADNDAFDHDYLGTHFPRLDQLDGSQGTTTARCIEGPYFRMTEVSFHTLDDLQRALETDVGRRILEDANGLAEKFGIRLDVLVVAGTT